MKEIEQIIINTIVDCANDPQKAVDCAYEGLLQIRTKLLKEFSERRTTAEDLVRTIPAPFVFEMVQSVNDTPAPEPSGMTTMPLGPNGAVCLQFQA